MIEEPEGIEVFVSRFGETFRIVETFVEPDGQVQFLYSKQYENGEISYQIAVADAQNDLMTFLGNAVSEQPLTFPRRYDGAFAKASGELVNGSALEVARAACKLHGKILGAIQ